MERLKNKYLNLVKASNALARSIQKTSNPPAYADEEDRACYVTALIKRFELTYEMSWKYLKLHLEIKYTITTLGSKDVFRKSFQANIINEAETEQLLDMVEDRNLASHQYDGELVSGLYSKVIDIYLPLFEEIQKRIGAKNVEVNLNE